jgi:hypothetical protein
LPAGVTALAVTWLVVVVSAVADRAGRIAAAVAVANMIAAARSLKLIRPFFLSSVTRQNRR